MKLRGLRGLILALCLAPAGAASVGGRLSRSSVPGRVTISDFAFAPTELVVSLGDTVEWTNSDRFIHTTRSDSGAWSSPELREGYRFAFAPSRAGRFPYHCAAHPVMRGVLVVRE